ncbi:putative F-box protein At1g67623 [Sesamum indicum]|uniref:F-box protein At1g67623 n=1 Tax=Sesamum indicum TaxID=4182 RepID=A0A6I9TV28_SESIN|nr:putative F-box protein At1g67623 [Sesamum indicum]
MSSNLDSIPKDLLTHILARVATSSLNSYFNVKLSCKMLKEVAECSNVYKCISLDEFPMDALHDMNGDVRSFINRCVECENLDALYMLGMIEYFSCNNLAKALVCLNKSASLGHVGAYYIITIILLLSGKDFKQRGVTLLSAMKSSVEYREKVKYYREKLIKFLRSAKTRNPKVLNGRPTCCTNDRHRFLETNALASVGNTDNYVFCDACTCDRELIYIFEGI